MKYADTEKRLFFTLVPSHTLPDYSMILGLNIVARVKHLPITYRVESL